MIQHRLAPLSRDVARWRVTSAVCAAALLLSGCGKSPFDQSGKAMEQGQQKQAAQDYRGAVAAYEKALDGTSKTADAHFRLGILYDQKLNDPLSAAHHFRRYVEVAPGGLHVKEANANTTRIERVLATSLNEGTLIGHAEALRLKQENADLRAQVAALKASLAASTSTSATAAGKAADRDAQHKLAPGTRTYQVQPGDSLASISRHFYRTPDRARDIQDANQNAISNPRKLKAGQTLIIP